VRKVIYQVTVIIISSGEGGREHLVEKNHHTQLCRKSTISRNLL